MIENIVNENMKNLNINSLAVAYSGGVDSVVLYHILIKLGYNVIPIHFNHNMRKESILEEKYIKNNIKNVKIGKCSHEIKSEKEARELRYGYFNQVMDNCNLDYLATGHHANDKVENFLMRLVKGTTVSGITGLSFLSNNNLLKNKSIIRPLINIKKKDIYKYAEENNLIWFEDSTNKELNYERNRYRNTYIPQLENENKLAVDHILNLSDEIEDIYRYLKNNVDLKYSENIKFTLFKQPYLPVKLFTENKMFAKEMLIKLLKNKKYIQISKDMFNKYLLFIGEGSVNNKISISKDIHLFKDIIDGEEVVILIDDSLNIKEQFPKYEKGKMKEKYNNNRIKNVFSENKTPYYLRKECLVLKEDGLIVDLIK